MDLPLALIYCFNDLAELFIRRFTISKITKKMFDALANFTAKKIKYFDRFNKLAMQI